MKLRIIRNLFLLSSILLLTCQKENLPPEATFTINPKRGTPSDVFYFNAEGCKDDNSSPYALEVRWDWENDGIWDTDFSRHKHQLQKFQDLGLHFIKMEVRDLKGAISSYMDTVYLWDKNIDTSFMTDPRDGRIYKTVKLEGRWWMAENLDYGQFVDFDVKPKDNGLVEKYCFKDKPSECLEYGGIYYWSEATAYNNDRRAQGICPPGWYIPDIEEWYMITKDYPRPFRDWYLGQGGLSSFYLNLNPYPPKFHNNSVYNCISGSYYVFDPHLNRYFFDLQCISISMNRCTRETNRDNYLCSYTSPPTASEFRKEGYYSNVRCIKDE